MADGRAIAFSPIQIGTLAVKNRLVAAPMVMNHATEDGHVTPRMLPYYAAKAAGGFGLVHVEASYIRPDGNMFGRMLGVYDDRQIPGLSELVEAIHQNGARCTIQLVHGGRVAPRCFTGVQPLAPSDETPPLSERPRGLTVQEIGGLVQSWVQAALRARAAGFDGVMIHGAHGFLLSQFASPYCNRRTDEYGRDRYLIVKQVVRAVREAVGPKYPVFYRVSADDFLGEAGLTIDETANVYAPLLEELGIDCIDVSGGIQERVYYNIQPLYSPKAAILYLAERVREKVGIPVIGVGRINDPRLIEHIFEQGKVDMLALARQSLADPDLPNKMREGRYEDVRKCITCDIGCSYRHIVQWVADCSINYEVTRETEFRTLMDRPTKPKKVAVVGGGPAGLEAARLAALKGHRVILYEKESEVGGLIRLSSNMPRVYMAELSNVVNWQKHELARLPVEIKLEVEATPEMVRQDGAEVVILAIGGQMLPLATSVDGGPAVVGLLDYLQGKAEIGQRVIVLGGHEGIEAALSLARRGHQVTVLEAGSEIADAPYLKYVGRQLLLKKMLADESVAVLTGASVEAVGSEGVVANVDGASRAFPADTVLVALGRKSDQEAIAAWQEAAPRVIAVGDCAEPRTIRNAMHSAARAVLSL
jgi:2,4-dienoyl-CoA reductase-like NADH-dependent reductase (Old Yellow Enzyme family)/thioredoxin reductase